MISKVLSESPFIVVFTVNVMAIGEMNLNENIKGKMRSRLDNETL